MTTETIVPKYVNQPKKPGGKFGTVKLADGKRYVVPVGVLASLTPGQTYEVDIQILDWTDGEVESIKAARPVGGAAPANGAARPVGAYGKTDDATAERIYVCGVVNSYVQHLGKFQGEADLADALVAVTKAARCAWQATFGKS